MKGDVWYDWVMTDKGWVVLREVDAGWVRLGKAE